MARKIESTLAIDALNARATAALSVDSESFPKGQRIPDAFSEYGGRRSPELHWGGVPSQTESIAILVEDPDAPTPTPFSHWVLFNVPASVRQLPESLPRDPKLSTLGGAIQGQPSSGGVGYFGPRPPKGDPPHHYHFEVFALEGRIELGPGATRDEVVNAMKGHVLASGELIATYQASTGA